MMRLTNKTLNLVDLLIEVSPTVITRDQGPQVLARDGLLAQLRAAVIAGMEGTGQSSAFGPKSPMADGAADLLDELSIMAAQALAAVSKQPTPYGHPEDHLRAFAELATEETVIELRIRDTVAKHRQDRKDAAGKFIPNVYLRTRRVKTAVLLGEMVDRIEDFFNPKSIREIPLPCPACGVRHIERVKDGEPTQANALNIHRDRDTMAAVEARCENCRAKWPAAQFPFLAKLLGLDVPEDLEALAVPEHSIEIVDGVPAFFCTAAADAPCHWWHACDCDWWPDDAKHEARHPKVQHETCAMTEWFSAALIRDFWSHPDDLPMPANHPRSGFEIEWEEVPLWWFNDIETPEEAA